MTAEEVVRAVERRFGLRFQPGLRSLVAGSAHELVAAGAAQDLAEVVSRVGTSAEDDPVVQRMRAAASVCETYFFRAAEQLRIVRELVMRSVLPQKSERALRIWSAGCATGEEAYTLAALFADVEPALEVAVVGTDMNELALQVAERGRYRRRSFRRSGPEEHARWFEEKDGEIEVRPELRRRVSFVPFNIVTDALPAELCGFDVVVCRNVLIYVEPDRIAQAIGKLAAGAASRAVLALAPAEYGAARHAAGFEPVRSAVFLRGSAVPRRIIAAPIVAPAARQPPILEEAVSPQPALELALPPPFRAPAPAAHPTPALPRLAAGDACRRAREAANAGEYVAAEELLREAIHTDPACAEAYHLLGSVHAARGALEQAIEELRRAVFLAPGLVAAHLSLGQALARAGRHAEARRHLRGAVRGAAAMADGDLVDELGVTAQSARRIAQDALDRLGDQA